MKIDNITEGPVLERMEKAFVDFVSTNKIKPTICFLKNEDFLTLLAISITKGMPDFKFVTKESGGIEFKNED